jgi:hypothetical protein
MSNGGACFGKERRLRMQQVALYDGLHVYVDPIDKREQFRFAHARRGHGLSVEATLIDLVSCTTVAW